MAKTRLSQIGIGVQAYETPVDVDLSTAQWGWTAYPLTVEYESAPITRLGQLGVGVSAYPPPSGGETVGLTLASWGWQSFPITIPGESFLLTQEDWGWQAFKPTICGQDPSGYAYSFNANVWPSCVFNEHVFGPRTATLVELPVKDWGWQPFDITVDFQDPVDVDLQLANWGWTNLPLAVSYGTDVNLQISAWGWQSFNLTIELPYPIDLQSATWGWTTLPFGVSYSYDVGLVTASYGWQTFPITVDVPRIDVDLTKKDWGWQSFPIEVKQTTLSDGDIQAIADAVYAKLVTEGLVQQVLETWRRQGTDPAYPQTIRSPDNGGNIECGDIIIEQEETPEGDVVQTRQ